MRTGGSLDWKGPENESIQKHFIVKLKNIINKTTLYRSPTKIQESNWKWIAISKLSEAGQWNRFYIILVQSSISIAKPKKKNFQWKVLTYFVSALETVSSSSNFPVLSCSINNPSLLCHAPDMPSRLIVKAQSLPSCLISPVQFKAVANLVSLDCALWVTQAAPFCRSKYAVLRNFLFKCWFFFVAPSTCF